MNRILLTVFSGWLLAGLSFAQNNQIPPGQAAQPQTTQPQGSQQIPDSSSPKTQPQAQSPTQSPAASQPTPGQPPSANSPAANTAGNHPKIAPGSVIPVQLTKTVDAKKAKTGDQVIAKVTQDMKTGNGDVLVPKDTKIIGHVTEAQARSKEQKESQMGIAFDHAVMKDGNQMDLPMSIQAVIGQQQQNNTASAPGGGDQGATASPSGMSGGGASGRPGAGSTPPAGSAQAPSDNGSVNDQNAKSAQPQINGQTTGVIGISNLSLSTGPNGTNGSVMTSEKNNVKLESGTMLLLKVNQ